MEWLTRWKAMLHGPGGLFVITLAAKNESDASELVDLYCEENECDRSGRLEKCGDVLVKCAN